MKLFWNDVENNKYYLGDLKKEENEYIFIINEEGLKMALKHGCFGIGNIDITKHENRSNELFDFFKNRIPKRDDEEIEVFLQIIGLEEYDEYEILKRTKAKLPTDRYYLEE